MNLMLRRILTFFVSIVGILGFLAGCSCTDIKPLEGMWSKLDGEVTSKIDGLTEQLGGAESIVNELAGQLDKNPELKGVQDGLMGRILEAKTAIEGFSSMFATEKAAILEAIKKGDANAVKTLLTGITGKFAEFTSGVGASIPALLSDTTSFQEKATAFLEAAAATMAAESTSPKSVVDLSGITFKPGSTQLDDAKSKESLDRLVTFAKTCPELRFSLVGHTSADGIAAKNKELSRQRAETIKARLLKAGVAKEVVTEAVGMGSDQPIVAEPAPGSDEAKTMVKADLEALRNQNRRIEVKVETPCP